MKYKNTRLIGKILIFASVLSFLTPTVSFAKEIDDPVPFETTTVMSDSTNTELDSGYRLLVLSNETPNSTYAYKIEKGKTNLYVLYYQDKEHMDYSYEVLTKEGYAVEQDTDILSPETDKSTTENNIQSDNLEDKTVSNKTVEEDKDKDKDQASKEITVAIIDSGLNTKYTNIQTNNGITTTEVVDNPLFKDRISDKTDEEALSDENGHGTLIAKIIAENSNAKILPIKAFKEDGTSNTRNIYYALMEALEKKADVINLSMEAVGTSEIIKKTIDYAVSLGVPVVVSAGNDNKDTKDYTPANVDSAFTIASCNEDGKKDEYSNFGSAVDFSMSGTYKDDNSTNIEDKTAEYTGTSFSTAYFSSLVASVLENGDYLKAKEDYMTEMNSLFISSSNGVSDEQIGYGKVDSTKVLSLAKAENKTYFEEQNKQSISSVQENPNVQNTEIKDDKKDIPVETKEKDTKEDDITKDKNTSSKNAEDKNPIKEDSKPKIEDVFFDDTLFDMLFNLADNEHGTIGVAKYVFYGTWIRQGHTLYLVVHSPNYKNNLYMSSAPGYASIMTSKGSLVSTDYYWEEGVSRDIQSLLNPNEFFTWNGAVEPVNYPIHAGSKWMDHDWFWIHLQGTPRDHRAYELDLTNPAICQTNVTHYATYTPNGGYGNNYSEAHTHTIGTNYGYNVPEYNFLGYGNPKYKHFVGWDPGAGDHEANDNVTVYAQWTWNNYRVNYNNIDADTKPNTWQTTNTSNDTYRMPSTPAKWNNITYNTDGGSSVNSQLVRYSFNGWRTTDSRSVDGINKNTYGSNEGFNFNSNDTDNAYVNVNAAWSDYNLTLPKAPTKDGYYFSGWKSSLDNNTYKAGEVVTVKHEIHKDITFTAVWTPVTVNILYSFGSSKNPDKENGKVIDGSTYQVGSATGNIYLKEYKDLSNYTENKTIKDTLNNRDMTYTERYSMQGWSYGNDKRYDTSGIYSPKTQKTVLKANDFYKEITSNNPTRVKDINDTVSNIRNKSHAYENKYQDSNLTAIYTDYSKNDYEVSGSGQATQVTVVLHAVWDKYPVIYAKDKFYSIDQLKYAIDLDTQQGLIGKDDSNFAAYVLGINKSSTDMADTENTTQQIFPSGKIVNPETYYNNQEEFFRKLGEVGQVSIPIEVTDLAGNTSVYPVRINVTNTDTNNDNSVNRNGDKINGSSGFLGESYTWDIRFIDGMNRNNVDEMSDHDNYSKNYTLDGSGIENGHKNGGLCNSSMWYVDPVWRKEIVATIYSNHDDVPKDSITSNEFNSEKSKLYTKVYTLDRNTIKRIQNIKKHDSSGRLTDWITSVQAKWAVNQSYLDLNMAAPISGDNISGYGTADVYIDGTLVSTHCADFRQLVHYGSTYRIVVSGNGTYAVDGESVFTGVMGTSDITVAPRFKLNTVPVTVTVNDYVTDSNGNGISLYSSRKLKYLLLIGSTQTFQPLSIDGYETPAAISKTVRDGLEINYYHTQNISPSYVNTTTEEPGERLTHIEFYPYGDSNAMVYASVFDYSNVPTWTPRNGQDDIDWYGRNGGAEITGNPAYPYATCIGHGYTWYGPWASINGSNVQRSQHEAWSTDTYSGSQCLQHTSYIPQIWVNYYVDGQLVHQSPKWLSVGVNMGEEPIWTYPNSKSGWTFKGWYSSGNNGWNSVGYFKPGMHVSMTSWQRSSDWVETFSDMRLDAVYQRDAWSNSN